ncbi:SubName: Full=Uncharacterized protein {ECO:0000313/EMBL:CCA71687.1} [Serendipita indica DSM 11827]|nr:SubName: Full=Uncharacterized protein {ECO:0000313/EMBL:CCA71687.1} [Serendipita indica DSM 11827]
MTTLCPNCNTRPINPGYQFCSKACATAATPQFLGQSNQHNNQPPPAYAAQAPQPMAQPQQQQPAHQSGGASALLNRFLGNRSGSSSQPQQPTGGQNCLIAGCGRPVYRDAAGNPSLYCGRKHMQQGQQMGLGQHPPAGAPAPGMMAPQPTGQPQTGQQAMMGHQPMASQGGMAYPYMGQPGQQAGMAYPQQPGMYPQTNQQTMGSQPVMGYPQMGQQQQPMGPQPGSTYPQMGTQPGMGYQQMGPQSGAYPQMGQQPTTSGMGQAPTATAQPPGTCQFQNCPKPVYVDPVTKKPSPYCSRTHMRMATGQQAPVPPTQTPLPGQPNMIPPYTGVGVPQQAQQTQAAPSASLYPSITGSTPAQQYAASIANRQLPNTPGNQQQQQPLMGPAYQPLSSTSPPPFNPQQPAAHGQNPTSSSEGTASPPPQPLSTGSLLQMCFLCRSKPPLPNDFFCSPDCRVRGKKFARDILDSEMPMDPNDTQTIPGALSEDDVDEFGLPLNPPTPGFATHNMSSGMDSGLAAGPSPGVHMASPVYAHTTGMSGNTASAYSGYDRTVPLAASAPQPAPATQQYQSTQPNRPTHAAASPAAQVTTQTSPAPVPAPSQSPAQNPAPAPVQQQYQPQYQQQQQQPAYQPYVQIPSGYVGHIEDNGGSWSPDETDSSAAVSQYKGTQQQQQQQHQAPPAVQPGMNTTVGYGTAAYGSYGAAPTNPAGGVYPYPQQNQPPQQLHHQPYGYHPGQPVNEDSMPD